MARRVNTKFVVIMTTALVVLVTGAVLMALKVQKTFAERMEMGDEALEQAEQNMAAGDGEAANAYYRLAWQHYDNAYGQDPTRIDVLYQSVDVYRKYGCTNVTEAKNQLDEIIARYQNAYAHNNATEEDRQRYLDLLYRYNRQGLIKDGISPWVTTINRTVSSDVKDNPDDHLARRYLAITGTINYRADLRETEIAEIRDTLDKALAHAPQDAELLAYRALFEMRQAVRLMRAEGNVGAQEGASEEAKAHYRDAAKYLQQAFAVQDRPAYVTINALQFALALPGQLMDRAELVPVLDTLLEKLANNAQERKDLTGPELLSLFQAAARVVQQAEQAEQAELIDRAIAVVDAAVQDRPEFSPYRMAYAQVLLWTKKPEASAEQIKKGLSIDRRRNAEEYLLNLTARVSLTELGVQAAIARAESPDATPQERSEQIEIAQASLKDFRDAEGGASDNLEAMADYYAGRICLIEGDYHAADRWLTAANRRFNQKHFDTLRLLGDIATTLQNNGEAARRYELALQLKNDALTQLKLIQVCLTLKGERLAQAIRLIDDYNARYPDDMRGYLVRAQALAISGNPAGAAQLLEQMDLSANPTVIPMAASYLREAGQTDKAMKLLRDRLAAEPNDQRAVQSLLGMLGDVDAKMAEVDRLAQAGLDATYAQTLRNVLRLGGSTNPEDQEELIRLSTDGNPVLTALSLYQLFANRGEDDKAKEALDQATALDPDHPGVLELRFQLALQEGDREEAFRIIDRLMALPPNERPRFAGDRVMLRTMAEASYHLKQGKIDDATRRDLIARYRKGLANDPNMIDGWLQLAQILAMGNEWPQARDAALKAYELQPNNVRGIIVYSQTLANVGDLPTALRVLEESLRATSNPLVRRQYLAIAQQGGYTNILLTEREKLAQDQPQDYDNRRALAELYLQADRTDQALTEIDAVIASEGPNLGSTWVKARALVAKDQPAAARQFVEAYITQRGEQANADDHLMLARVMLLTGEVEPAVSAYEAAAAVDSSENHMASRIFAALLAQAGQPVEASRLYRELVQQHPQEDELKLALAQTLLMSNALEQAEAALQGLAESAGTMLTRYDIATRQNQPDKARQILESAYTKFPEDNRVALPYARALLAAGETEKAGPVVRSLVQRAGSSTDVQMVLAQLELQQGDQAGALARLSLIVQNVPNYFPAREAQFNLLRAQSTAMAPINPGKALELAEQALDAIAPLAVANPDNLMANRLAGQAALLAQKPNDAVLYLEKAYRLDGGEAQLNDLTRALINAQNYQRAIDLLRAPENASTLNESVTLTALWARALAGAGNTDQAVTLYTSLLRDHTDIATRVGVSRLIFESFDSSKAIQVIDAALGNDRIAEVDLQITQLLSAQQRWNDVLARLDPYEASPAKNPQTQRTILGQIALACQQSGAFERAKKLYEQVLEDEPDNINILNNLAYMLCDDLPGYEQDALKYAEHAVKTLEKASGQTSDLSRALVLDTLGWAQYRAGQPDKAIATLEKSIAIEEVHANVVHLARVHMGLDNDNRALRLLDDAAAAARRSNNQKDLDEIAALKQELSK